MSVETSRNKTRILLVEDDLNLGFLLVDFLESQGFEVKLYRDGESGLRGFTSNSFDFCILDLMLPKIDGFTLLEKIKLKNSDIPVIILSARSLKEDKIKGFRLGVDDYITKPFDEEELLFRIMAIINRTGQVKIPERQTRTASLGQYVFDPSNQMLKIGEKCQRLTIKENKILELLVNSANSIVQREELMVTVWGESDYFIGRSLDVFISKLRAYLKDDQNIKLTTIPTVGYVLEIS
jgi:DNA-binding response OmpR family regulator